MIDEERRQVESSQCFWYGRTETRTEPMSTDGVVRQANVNSGVRDKLKIMLIIIQSKALIQELFTRRGG